MIFNIPLGGSSYITVTAPSTSSVSATCSGMTVSGTGSCTLEVPIIGEWVVTCVYDGATKTQTVNVETFGESYSTTFTYNATITISCPSGASIVASMSGQTNVTRTGPGSITVPKKGTWSVSCTYDGSTQTKDVAVAYGGSESVSFTYNATITISCPSGASIVASMSGQTNVTRTGPGSITVPKKGTWSVSCTYDGSTQSKNVIVAYGGSESVSFAYSCTITVNTQIGAYVTISKSGYGSDSKTANSNGQATFTVSKSGAWSVTTEYARGTYGATSKSGSVTAVYGETKPISIYPRIYIYRCDKGSGVYIGLGGFNIFDSDGNVRETVDTQYPYGGWKDFMYKSYDSGNNVVVTVQDINLSGYTKMHCYGRYLDAYEVLWGIFQQGNDMYNEYTWSSRGTIKAKGTRTDCSFQDFEMIFSVSGKGFPVLRNLGGSSDLSADMEIHEWWLE